MAERVPCARRGLRVQQWSFPSPAPSRNRGQAPGPPGAVASTEAHAPPSRRSRSAAHGPPVGGGWGGWRPRPPARPLRGARTLVGGAGVGGAPGPWRGRLAAHGPWWVGLGWVAPPAPVRPLRGARTLVGGAGVGGAPGPRCGRFAAHGPRGGWVAPACLVWPLRGTRPPRVGGRPGPDAAASRRMGGGPDVTPPRARACASGAWFCACTPVPQFCAYMHAGWRAFVRARPVRRVRGHRGCSWAHGFAAQGAGQVASRCGCLRGRRGRFLCGRFAWRAGQVVVWCNSASARARSRERRAGPRQPQVQWAKQKEPRSVVPVRWVGASVSASWSTCTRYRAGGAPSPVGGRLSGSKLRRPPGAE